MNDYVQSTERLFKSLKDRDALKEFCNAMRQRAMLVSRNIVSADDDNTMHALRGQLSICFELADGAESALEAEKAKANADSAGRIQNEA